MKKLKLFLGLTTVVCVCATLSFGMNLGKLDQMPDVLFSSVEALAQGESGGTVIKCYCMAWYQTGRNCAVDGADTSAGPCAQSQPGGNVNCNDYNSNCK